MAAPATAGGWSLSKTDASGAPAPMATGAGDDALRAAKRALRAEAEARRARARQAAGADAGARIREHFWQGLVEPGLVPPDAAVSGFWPIRDEIDVRPLLEALAARGHVCALPVIVGRGRPLIFRRWRPGDALEAASFGLHEPLASAPEVEPRVLLVPLLAFDGSGRRLGYGAGYYDRTLARLRDRTAVLAIGIAYAGQRFESVPAGADDEPLDWVVTEQSALRLG